VHFEGRVASSSIYLNLIAPRHTAGEARVAKEEGREKGEKEMKKKKKKKKNRKRKKREERLRANVVLHFDESISDCEPAADVIA